MGRKGRPSNTINVAVLLSDTAAVVSHMPWIEKTESRLWWRGNPNSAFIYDQWDWRSSQRFKLSDWASGRRPVGAAQDGHSPVLLEIDGIVERKWVDPDVLRGTYLNVSLVNSVRQISLDQ